MEKENRLTKTQVENIFQICSSFSYLIKKTLDKKDIFIPEKYFGCFYCFYNPLHFFWIKHISKSLHTKQKLKTN